MIDYKMFILMQIYRIYKVQYAVGTVVHSNITPRCTRNETPSEIGR